jgi:hypothetical protein
MFLMRVGRSPRASRRAHGGLPGARLREVVFENLAQIEFAGDGLTLLEQLNGLGLDRVGVR